MAGMLCTDQHFSPGTALLQLLEKPPNGEILVLDLEVLDFPIKGNQANVKCQFTHIDSDKCLEFHTLAFR
jgi:hypothetical protein